MRLKAAVAAGAVGGLWALNRRLEREGRAPAGPGGEARRFRWRGHELAYSVAGEGEPLLLVHGVYAGASSLEFRENFEELSGGFRVYALDLLGCGLSEKPRRRYGPEDVASQVEDFVNEEVGGGAHLIASSLTAALVVPATVRSPKLFKKLVLVCPTGYGTLDRPSGRVGDAVLGLFRAKLPRSERGTVSASRPQQRRLLCGTLGQRPATPRLSLPATNEAGKCLEPGPWPARW